MAKKKIDDEVLQDKVNVLHIKGGEITDKRIEKFDAWSDRLELLGFDPEDDFAATEKNYEHGRNILKVIRPAGADTDIPPDCLVVSMTKHGKYDFLVERDITKSDIALVKRVIRLQRKPNQPAVVKYDTENDLETIEPAVVENNDSHEETDGSPAVVKDDTKTDPISVQYAAYSKAYDYFNKTLFDGRLPRCLLNFSRKSKRTIGFFSPQRWERDGTFAHEISLNPDHFGRSARETLSTLVHEMAHLWQEDEGKPSRNGYHNAEWGRKMDDLGLTPSSTGLSGGNRTGQSMSHVILEDGRYSQVFADMPTECLMPWLSGMPASRPKKSTPKVKYTCPSCACNAWGKPDIRLVCGGCSVELV
jgi:hypothetical protein